MNDKFYSKRVKIKNNYKIDNHYGDTIINVPAALILIAGIVGLVCYVLYKGTMVVFGWFEYVVFDLSMRFKAISNTISDPEVKPYFIAILCLLFVAGIGLIYLWHRFNVYSFITKFFDNEEDDKDWADIL